MRHLAMSIDDDAAPFAANPARHHRDRFLGRAIGIEAGMHRVDNAMREVQAA